MRILYGLILAFSMYSRIPMPKIRWEKERMGYVFVFFPLVGLVLAVFTSALGFLWRFVQPGEFLRAAVGTALPVLITGGIHMDGFLDVIDARASCQPAERKREILKDPHAGAFAIVGACVYFLLYAGFFSALPIRYYGALGGVFVAERALSGLSVVTFPKAAGSGLAATFAENAKRHLAAGSLALWLILTAVFWIFLCPSGSWLCIPVLAALFVRYYVMSRKEFGGITGDLAGYFLQQAELWCLAALAAAAWIYS